MPRGSDWFNFVYVNMAYLALIFVISIFLRLQEIRKNWPKYRCNPVYMPFADDVSKNFTHCVQNMQANYMGYLLQPIWTTISSMQSMATDTMGSLQNFRTIAIKDSVAKLSGTVVTFMYMMDGVRMTLGSVWSGPPGQMTRSLCFHPETLVTLQDGEKKAMKNVCLGNVLNNGSRVIGTMCIANENEEAMFRVPIQSEGSSVLVTGAHYILNCNLGKYIRVRDHPDAIPVRDVPAEFACLITDDHKICIGDREFWDWDDDAIPDKMR